jgi:ATP-dependent DNA helicase RecQ
MDRYCRGATCRHQGLVRYFGQEYTKANCAACDVCLGDTQEVADSLVVAQKILSCVARVNQGFGVGHVAAVLRGDNTDAIRQRQHDQLSTYGLLRGTPKPTLRDWISQLVGQEVLIQTGDEYPILKLNAASWEVMRGQRTVRLMEVSRREKRAATVVTEEADAELFERLRALRREIAAAEQVPAYVVFPDTVLLALARARPTTPDAMRQITGIGEAKLRAYGAKFLTVLREHVAQNPAPPARPVAIGGSSSSIAATARRQTAFDLFRGGAVVTDVMHQLKLARSTICDYLAQYIQAERPADISAWVADDVYQEVAAAAREVGTEKLKPIYQALNEQVPYDDIRLVLAHLAARPPG